jgi:hypothetical protein
MIMQHDLPILKNSLMSANKKIGNRYVASTSAMKESLKRFPSAVKNVMADKASQTCQ